VRGVVGDAAGVVVVMSENTARISDTGTGPARRRLTLDEAQRGVQPEPFSVHEWDAMHAASAQETTDKHTRLIAQYLRARNLL
jgi:hypothetical protein